MSRQYFIFQIAFGLLCWQSVFAETKLPDLSPLSVEGATTIDTHTAKALYDLKDIVFIDVRNDDYWAKGHITGAVHLQIPNQLTPTNLEKYVGQDDPLVFYCHGLHCWRSHDASVRAIGWGFKQVYYYRGGFPAWQAAGYPITVGNAQK